MCGRFTLSKPVRAVAELFALAEPPPELKPRYSDRAGGERDHAEQSRSRSRSRRRPARPPTRRHGMNEADRHFFSGVAGGGPDLISSSSFPVASLLRFGSGLFRNPDEEFPITRS